MCICETHTHTHTQSHLSTPIDNRCQQLTIIISCNVVHADFFVCKYFVLCTFCVFMLQQENDHLQAKNKR